MANLYIYGCSFSQGSWVNIKEPQHYCPFYQHQFKDYYWGKQVGDYFGLGVRERAIGGGANYTSLSRVMEDSHQYSEGDKVIIGLTKGSRYSLEPIRKADFEQGEVKIDTYSDINIGLVREYFRQQEAKTTDIPKDSFKTAFLYGPTLEKFDDDDLAILMHFHQMWREELDEIYEKHYIAKFKQLQGMLFRAGVNCYVWHNDIWGEFQRIVDWLQVRRNLNQRKVDFHWSPNGNTSFAAFAITQIQNDVGYWSSSDVTLYKKALDHNVLGQLQPFVDSNFEVDTSWYDEETYPWLKNRKDIY